MFYNLTAVAMTGIGLLTMVYGGYLGLNLRESVKGGSLEDIANYFLVMIGVLSAFYIGYLSYLGGYLFSFEVPSTARVIMALIAMTLGLGTVGIMREASSILTE